MEKVMGIHSWTKKLPGNADSTGTVRSSLGAVAKPSPSAYRSPSLANDSPADKFRAPRLSSKSVADGSNSSTIEINGATRLYPDLTDPIDEKIIRIEEVLRRYNLQTRPDFQELMLELIILVLMMERVANTKWILINMCLKKTAVDRLPPPEMVLIPTEPTASDAVLPRSSSLPNFHSLTNDSAFGSTSAMGIFSRRGRMARNYSITGESGKESPSRCVA